MRAAPLAGVAAGSAGQLAAALAGAGGVHRSEAGCGEGGEHARMRGHGLGDALAAGQAGADDLPGVVLVDLGAGRADVLAAVAAGDQQHAAGFGVGVVHGAGLAGGAVDGVDAALRGGSGWRSCRWRRAGLPSGGSRRGRRGRGGLRLMPPPPGRHHHRPGGESDGRDCHRVLSASTQAAATAAPGSVRFQGWPCRRQGEQWATSPTASTRIASRSPLVMSLLRTERSA